MNRFLSALDWGLWIFAKVHPDKCATLVIDEVNVFAPGETWEGMYSQKLMRLKRKCFDMLLDECSGTRADTTGCVKHS